MKASTAIKYVGILLIAGWWASLGCAQKKGEDLVLPEERAALDSLTLNFFTEASRRGVDVSTWAKSVQVQFGTLERKHAGSCRPKSYPKVVTIDHFYWKISSFADREQLLFHELAHCLLQRKHRTDTFARGECKSWMREKNYDCVINLRNPVWRSYYLDELFGKQGSEDPEWYQLTAESVERALYKKQSTITLTNSGSRLDSLLTNQSGDWAMFMKFPPVNPDNNPTYFGLSVNEMVVEYTNYNSTHSGVFEGKIVADARSKPFIRRIGETPAELSIQKRNDLLYLFLNDSLRYCLPLANNKLTFWQYGSPSGQYVIDMYTPR